MIISKPRTSALFSLSIFIVISLSLSYAGIMGPVETGVWKWYNYIAVYFFGPLAFILAMRMLWKFKVLGVGKMVLSVWYPFRFSKRRFDLTEIEFWNEEQVKTGKTLFRELEINFGGSKVKISNQENGSYDQIFRYLNKKLPKKKQK